MGREIKFRGKRIDNGEWVIGDLTQDRDLKKCYIEGWEYYYDDGGLQREPFGYEVISETVGEYTGLKDKNGTEIYEGDILKVLFKEARIGASKKYYHYIVKHQDLEASFDLFGNEELLGRPCFISTNQSIFEVIGNIYDMEDSK